MHTPEQLRGARRFATRYGRLLGLPPDGIADVTLITTELATNSLYRSAGPCRLALWQLDGHLICEARDSGPLDPLAGRSASRPDADDELGLYVVNGIADLVRMHTAADGSTIQVHLKTVPSHRNN